MPSRRKIGYVPFEDPDCERARKKAIEICVESHGKKSELPCQLAAGVALEKYGCRFPERFRTVSFKDSPEWFKRIFER